MQTAYLKFARLPDRPGIRETTVRAGIVRPLPLFAVMDTSGAFRGRARAEKRGYWQG